MSDAPPTPQGAAGLRSAYIKAEPNLPLAEDDPETKPVPAFGRPPVPFGTTPYTAHEAHQIGRQLAIPLSKKDVKTRPGPGGKPLTYIEGWRAIDIANSIFGFDGWSSQLVCLDVRSCRQTPTKRWNACVMATMRITLRNGTFHEDRGGGIAENKKTEEEAQMAAEKEAITDACKRTLKNFGRRLGLSLYSDEHLRLLNSKAVTAPQPQRTTPNGQQPSRCSTEQHPSNTNTVGNSSMRDQSQLNANAYSKNSSMHMPQTHEHRDQSPHMQQPVYPSTKQQEDNNVRPARVGQTKERVFHPQTERSIDSSPGHRPLHNLAHQQTNQGLQMNARPSHSTTGIPQGQMQVQRVHGQSHVVQEQGPPGPRHPLQSIPAFNVTNQRSIANPSSDKEIVLSPAEMQLRTNQQGLQQDAVLNSRKIPTNQHDRTSASRNELGLMRPPLPVRSTSTSKPTVLQNNFQCDPTHAQNSVYQQGQLGGNETNVGTFRHPGSSSLRPGQPDARTRTVPDNMMSPVTPYVSKASHARPEVTPVRSAVNDQAFTGPNCTYPRASPDEVQRNLVGSKRPWNLPGAQVPAASIPSPVYEQGMAGSGHQRNSGDQQNCSKIARIGGLQARYGGPSMVASSPSTTSRTLEGSATATVQNPPLPLTLANASPAIPYRKPIAAEDRNRDSSEVLPETAGSDEVRNSLSGDRAKSEVEELCAIWASDMG